MQRCEMYHIQNKPLENPTHSWLNQEEINSVSVSWALTITSNLSYTISTYAEKSRCSIRHGGHRETSRRKAEIRRTIPCKCVQLLWRTVWRFLKKLKTELPYVPAIPLLGIYLGKTIIQKDTRTLVSIAASFMIAKRWKQPKCPSTDEWIEKISYIQWNITQP